MEWHNIFKLLKGKCFQPKILYWGNLSFRIEGGYFSIPLSTKDRSSDKFNKETLAVYDLLDQMNWSNT